MTLKIVRDRSLPWLIGGLSSSRFSPTFSWYILDSRVVRDDNVAQWEKDRTRKLDYVYLYSLGAEAWPCLAPRATRSIRTSAVLNTYTSSGAGPRSAKHREPKRSSTRSTGASSSLRAY